MTDFGTLVTGLRQWTKDHDPYVRAAVELLIWHETWIRRGDFVDACVTVGQHDAWIRWGNAREFVGSGPLASTSEMAVLKFAVALGNDEYRFSCMGAAHANAIVTAVQEAFGMRGNRG